MNARPVDLVHLARYTGGDQALNAEVLQLFVNQAGELVRRMDGVLQTGDAKTWREVAHSLKGAARGIGAFAMADAAAACEPIDPASDTTGRRRRIAWDPEDGFRCRQDFHRRLSESLISRVEP